jgi:hypothetical protein
MTKKIIGIIIILAVIALAIYIKVWYPGSQLQLRNTFRYVEAFPVEHFQNATEKTCGIWYTGSTAKDGADNLSIKDCFTQAFGECASKNILIVKDASETAEQSVIYSLLRILRKNDLNECIIQNYYEEMSVGGDENAAPLSYINTCTILAEDLSRSCEPLFIKELREQKKAVGPTITNPTK